MHSYMMLFPIFRASGWWGEILNGAVYTSAESRWASVQRSGPAVPLVYGSRDTLIFSDTGRRLLLENCHLPGIQFKEARYMTIYDIPWDKWDMNREYPPWLDTHNYEEPDDYWQHARELTPAEIACMEASWELVPPAIEAEVSWISDMQLSKRLGSSFYFKAEPSVEKQGVYYAGNRVKDLIVDSKTAKQLQRMFDKWVEFEPILPSDAL